MCVKKRLVFFHGLHEIFMSTHFISSRHLNIRPDVIIFFGSSTDADERFQFQANEPQLVSFQWSYNWI